jgi:hypothetical protein
VENEETRRKIFAEDGFAKSYTTPNPDRQQICIFGIEERKQGDKAFEVDKTL